MNQVIQCDKCRAESLTRGGYDMDDILRRLMAVESSVSALSAKVAGIAAVTAFLQTNADSIGRRWR